MYPYDPNGYNQAGYFKVEDCFDHKLTPITLSTDPDRNKDTQMIRTTTIEKVYILKGTCGPETSKAIRFTIEEINGISINPEEIDTMQWFPFSQVTKIMRNSINSEKDELHVKKWILQQKGLI